MNGWEVIGWSAVSGFGALLFLRLVSHQIWVTEVMLDRLEDQEREAHRERQVPPNEEPVTGVLAAKLN